MVRIQAVPVRICRVRVLSSRMRQAMSLLATTSRPTGIPAESAIVVLGVCDPDELCDRQICGQTLRTSRSLRVLREQPAKLVAALLSQHECPPVFHRARKARALHAACQAVPGAGDIYVANQKCYEVAARSQSMSPEVVEPLG
jgi:hypothetical protein